MDICRHAHLHKSQASRTVNAMLAKEILARAGNDRDGRSVIISLTDEGRRIFGEIGATLRSRDSALYHGLNEAERMALGNLLDKALASHGVRRF